MQLSNGWIKEDRNERGSSGQQDMSDMPNIYWEVLLVRSKMPFKLSLSAS